MDIGIREKNAIKVAIAAFVAAGIPYFLSSLAADYWQEEVNRGRELQTELLEVRKNRTSVVEQVQLYDAYLESYQQWYDRGVITEFPDTEPWRTVMYDIKQKRDLGVIDFTFGEGRRITSDQSDFTKDSTASMGILPMHISMPMLHGMDIFMFLGDMESRVEGLFLPLSCEITRLETVYAAELRNNLRGECDVVWVVMQDPDRVNREAPDGEESV